MKHIHKKTYIRMFTSALITAKLNRAQLTINKKMNKGILVYSHIKILHNSKKDKQSINVMIWVSLRNFVE